MKKQAIAAKDDDEQLDLPVTEVSQLRSAVLAEVLRKQILSGEYKLGDPLSSERDLMTQYSCSRATVREALRSLGAQGLIEVRRGRNGGSYVCGPSSRTIRNSLDLFISGYEIKYSDLTAAREAIEPVAAAQAALNRSDQDVHELHELTRAGETSIPDIDKFSEINLNWHMAVVRASKNPLFIGFMDSISSALYTATNRKEFDLQTRKLVMATHRKIFEAIRDGDVEAAQRRMGSHVSAYVKRLAVSS